MHQDIPLRIILVLMTPILRSSTAGEGCRDLLSCVGVEGVQWADPTEPGPKASSINTEGEDRRGGYSNIGVVYKLHS